MNDLCIKCDLNPAMNNKWCKLCYDTRNDVCGKCGHRKMDHVFTGLGNGRCSESTAVGKTCCCPGFMLK